MTTASEAFASIRSRIEDNKPASVALLRWQNEDGDPLPDTPANFIYTEIVTEPQFLAGFGGGQGANLWRNPGRIECYVFVPRGQGVAVATDIAETIAGLFRGYRSSVLQCFGASVYAIGSAELRLGPNARKPPGLVTSEIDNYYCAVAEVDLWFDQIG